MENIIFDYCDLQKNSVIVIVVKFYQKIKNIQTI